VFDVGSIFHIDGSDQARSTFRHLLFSRLEEPATWERVRAALLADEKLLPAFRDELLGGPLESMIESGARTHHAGMVDAVSGEVVKSGLPANPSPFNVVRRYPVLRPPQRDLLGAFVFDYSQFHQSDTYVIPLEFIVRFGITSGSSVLRQYQALSEAARQSYIRELGLRGPMVPWSVLEQPVFDFTSKYEPEDRNVSKQEALLMSGLGGSHFLNVVKMSVLGGLALRELLRPVGLLLWDLKWEFAVDRDTVLFADTMDSDSFRATRFMEVEGRRVVIHYNKQAMRDYYRLIHGEWYSGINTAKVHAKEAGRPFKEVLREGQGRGIYPQTPAADPEFLDIQSRKTALISRHLVEPDNATAINEKLEACGRDEIDFYRRHQRLEAFIKANAVD
jgi:phosphoribosylaminoimidazole-succinocarboxamide synthase